MTLLERVGLTDVADDRVRGFSLGMRQRLGLAAALLTTPAAAGARRTRQRPRSGRQTPRTPCAQRARGRWHRDRPLESPMDDLAALCSEITLLARGRVVFSGPISELAPAADELDYRLRNVRSGPRPVESRPRCRLPAFCRTMTCTSVVTLGRFWCVRRCRPSMIWSRASSAPRECARVIACRAAV